MDLIKFSGNFAHGPRKRSLNFGNFLAVPGTLTFDLPKIKTKVLPLPIDAYRCTILMGQSHNM